MAQERKQKDIHLAAKNKTQKEHTQEKREAQKEEREVENVSSLSLREKKAANTRLAIGRVLMEEMKEQDLSKITVDKIAQSAGISRMTFFNYFETKEHAVEWMFAAQMKGIFGKSKELGYRGRAAIEHVFETMGEYVQENPNRMRRLVSHFASSTAYARVPELTNADLDAVGLKQEESKESDSLGEWLMLRIGEAKSDKEISEVGTSYELAHMLGALLIGGCMIGRSQSKPDWRRLYRHHVECALGPKKEAKATNERANKQTSE